MCRMVALNRKNRLISLDALRGFDMFWIIGGASIGKGIASLDLSWSRVIVEQLNHSPWNGFTFYDLIFPLFIFMTGASVVLSLTKRREAVDRGKMIKHILKRTTLLFVVGIIYNHGPSLSLHLADIRIMGVLQRIALCYLFASFMVLYARPKTQALTVVGILVSYWALMKFVPVPGYGPGVWTEQGNLARYIDVHLLPGSLFFGSWDPEGLLTTVPALATCLLGVFAGYCLTFNEFYRGRVLNPNDCARYMLIGGLLLVIAGILLNRFFPINKNLWTSSYVLLTGGLSSMLLAAFYWIVDIREHRSIVFPFILIGMNSIFIYLLVRFIPFNQIASWLVTASHQLSLGQSEALIAAIAEIGIEVLLLLWLYRRRIFIRI